MLSRIQGTHIQQNKKTHRKRVTHTGIEEETRDVDPNRPSVDVYQKRCDVDPFPDPQLNESMDQNEQLQLRLGVQKTLQAARESGLHETYSKELQQVTHNKLNQFWIKFSPVVAKIPLLHIVFHSNRKPLRVKLQN